MNSETHVSKALKSQALQNIKAKHTVIKKWISEGIPWLISEDGLDMRDSKGELILDWYPSSLRRFCAWNGTQNSPAVQSNLPKISTTGFGTLKGHKKLMAKIEMDIFALKQKADTQLAYNNKANLILKLKNELKLEVQKRKSAQVSYQQGREELIEFTNMLNREKRSHMQTTAYLKSEVAKKDEQIVTLNQRVADLTASLDKVAPLRSVKG